MGSRHSCPLQRPPWESGSIMASASLICFSFSSGRTLRPSLRPELSQEALGPPGRQPSAWPGCGLSAGSPGPVRHQRDQPPCSLPLAELTFCRPSSAWPRGRRVWETAPTVTGPCTGQLGDRDSGHLVPLPPHPPAPGGCWLPAAHGPELLQLSAGPRNRRPQRTSETQGRLGQEVLLATQG